MVQQLISNSGIPYLQIRYDDANNWVHNNWIGYQSRAGIINGANHCLQTLLVHECAYLLNDNRQVLGPWDHAVDWIVTEWAPYAIEHGLTHFAHINSPDLLARYSADTMYLGLDGQLQMRRFDDIASAQTWLREAQLAERNSPEFL